MDSTDNKSRRTAQDPEGLKDLNFYKFVLESLPTAVVTVNADRKITGFNPWAEKITGYSAEEAIGRYCGDILQGGMCKTQCPLKTVLNGHKPLSLVETTISDKWGKTIPVRMNTAGLFDDDDRLIGGVESFQDISRIKTLEREKGHLISMLAHDMRSSLSIIAGFALRLLKMWPRINDEKRCKYLDIIIKNANKLEDLVNDFLEFSRLQTGKLKLEMGPTSVDRELMELFDAYQLKAKESGISLEFENEENLSIIQADAKRLRRVFTNLLDNALKFSNPGGKITLSTLETDGDIIVKIEDQGIGIDRRDLPYIFDSFFRGAGVDKKKGFGLGLAGVKAIVEGHGGRISVKSEPGKGSMFSVILPKDMDFEE
ncbi:MAG: PAS domain-containing sensor histidine kinase [Deltaproteobacteria bacterium]|nr:PAS domain-containing sensor histidine kinase [Deltaproteobacteria bacterium]